MNRYFLDTSYLIALIIERDALHTRALQLSLRIEKEQGVLITTRAVLLELGNALSSVKYRQLAAEFLSRAETDPNVHIVDITQDLYQRSLDLFRDRRDKNWGVVDCISFCVMKDGQIEQALTADEHFIQAGFRSLLREDQ